MTANSLDDFRVRLAPPAVWQPALAAACRGQAPAVQRFTQAALTALHRRHIGLTPELAAALAPLVLYPRASRPQSGAWGAVYDRLLASLHTTDAHAAPTGVSLILNVRPAYVLLRIAAPVIQVACRRLGYTCLPSGDAAGATVTAAEYEEYDRALTAAVGALAAAADDALALFWQERALALAALARGADPDLSPLPEPDPLATALFLRLEPDTHGLQEPTRRTHRLTLLQRRRDQRWHEAGFDGIHVTRREEELPLMLLTEWLQDPVTRADRLLNSGFYALEREPRRTRLRDVLITGFAPAPLWNTLAGDLIKACWFDFAARVGLLLRQNNLLQSEFRWIEADPAWRTRTLILRLGDLPDSPAPQEREPKAPFRSQFRAALQWLPRFLDSRSGAFAPLQRSPRQRRSGAGTTAGLGVDPAAGERQPLLNWAAVAWQQQEEDPLRQLEQPVGASQFLGATAQPLAAEEFLHVHHMLFLPAQLLPDEAAARTVLTTQVAGRFRAARAYQGAANLTWAPLHLEDPAAWRFTTTRHAAERLVPAGEEATVARIAGCLSTAWLAAFVQEAARG